MDFSLFEASQRSEILCHRATDAHLGPVKPSGATGKSLIVLNPGLTLNQLVCCTRRLDDQPFTRRGPSFADAENRKIVSYGLRYIVRR
jgi:hypothetical protein